MRLILLAAILTISTTSSATPETNQDSEKDDDTSRKIIGSSVVTSVSVILNGEEPPKFSDAVGKPVPRPIGPQVASPINLLNPDRYEFYTFNDSGDLIKRLMTMKEIQSIVAGGSNEGSMMHQSSIDQKLDDNVEDIVTSVQKVLNEEVEANKNVSIEHNILDTPDVSSSWSIILPAIFGNTGDEIRPHKPQLAVTPDAVIVDGKPNLNKNNIRVKPSNIGSGNVIEDFANKKTVEKPLVTEEPIVHINKKKPISGIFEASTPRSNANGYHEHSLDEIKLDVHRNHSLNGYRSKTTAVPIVTSTTKVTTTPKPTPSRFVTRRRPTPVNHHDRRTTTTTSAPEDPITDNETIPILMTTNAPETPVTGSETIPILVTKVDDMTENSEKATDSSMPSFTTTADIDAATEQTTIVTTAWNTFPELTTQVEERAETTTAQAQFTETSNIVVTTQTDSEVSTEYSNEFDSNNSFNQILESLKDDSATDTIGLLGNDENVLSLIGSTTFLDDSTTTESIQVDDNHDHTTVTDREMIKLPNIDVMQQINQSNVYMNEEMFVDEQEPLIFDIPTTTESNIDTTEHSEEATFKDEDLTLPIFQAVKLQYPESSSIFQENNPIVQQVDNYIRDNPEEVADSLAVESVDNENKIANVVALENLTLSEFIEQAATVASILSNDAENVPIRDIVNQLILSPQLRNDESEVSPTTNVPAKFDEMEVLSLKNDNMGEEQNVSYETSVIKETSSISMSSNQPAEELSKSETKNQSSSDNSSMEQTDASTEISVESDVHEVLNMIKMKMPPNTPKITTFYNDTDEQTVIATEAAVTEITEENVTSANENLSTIQPDFQHSIDDKTTGIKVEASDIQDDLRSVTLYPHSDNIDRTTLASDIDLTSQTTNPPTPTENSVFSGSFAADILDTIGMIDEDVIADKFNISLSEEDVEEDVDDSTELHFQSTTLTSENPSTETDDEHTTVYNYYQETFENEIIKKLQETLEERLYPKTERSDIDQFTYPTEQSIEITTNSVATEHVYQMVSTEQTMDALNNVDPTEESLNEELLEFTTTTENMPVEVTATSENMPVEVTATSENMPVEVTATTEIKPIEVTATTEIKSIEVTDTTEMKPIEVTDTTETKVNELTVTPLFMELITEFASTPTDESNFTNNEITTIESTTDLYPKDEETFIKLGETTVSPTTVKSLPTENDITTQPSIINIISTKKHAALKIDDRTSAVKTPSQQYFRPHQNEQKVFYVNTPKPSTKIMTPSFNTLKIKVSNSNRRPMPVKLDPAPKQALGLEESTMDVDADILEFTKLCNELAFTFWKSLTSEGISSARSLVISPFALTSMLSMIFLGARGSTSGEMNEMLRLDDMVTFNPHLIFRNITDSVENTKDSGLANSAFVRELFSDRSKGKILSFYKDKAQQFYSGHVEEVNFNVINDIIRRRTNLLVKRHTWGKITEYLKTNNIWLNPPLAGLSANIFQTDCSKATVNERDGEMFFQVLPAIRQRRLVPIPAAVYKSNFMAGYDPEIDATAVAFGGTDVVSTIFVMPGQQGHSAPGDNLERLESVFMTNAVTNNAWRRLLTTLMPRQGLEVQIPRFSHRSFINATYGLQKMGLSELFNFDKADLRGLTGSTTKDMYISDMIQINTFSTCGEDKIGDQHHVELYPAPPIQQRNINYQESPDSVDYADVSVSSISEEERSLYDPLFDDQKYLELPLPLRPRQARIPEAPRLRFDKPFMYFVRHNPTGMILYMGRFNPRLLP